MGLAKETMLLLLFIVVFALVDVSMGAVYKVGDSAGWTNSGHVDYKTWSATKNFSVGDIFVFEYNKQLQNVVRVTHKNFRACNATSPYAVYATGNDSFAAKRPGHFYFICSVPGHCEAGQKVDMRVLGPRPITPTPLIPSWAPRQAPTPTPAPAPHVPSPLPSPSAPAPTQALTPTPAPLASTPAPAPAPAPLALTPGPVRLAPTPAPPAPNVPLPSPSALTPSTTPTPNDQSPSPSPFAPPPHSSGSKLQLSEYLPTIVSLIAYAWWW